MHDKVKVRVTLNNISKKELPLFKLRTVLIGIETHSDINLFFECVV